MSPASPQKISMRTEAITDHGTQTNVRTTVAYPVVVVRPRTSRFDDETLPEQQVQISRRFSPCQLHPLRHLSRSNAQQQGGAHTQLPRQGESSRTTQTPPCPTCTFHSIRSTQPDDAFAKWAAQHTSIEHCSSWIKHCHSCCTIH